MKRPFKIINGGLIEYDSIVSILPEDLGKKFYIYIKYTCADKAQNYILRFTEKEPRDKHLKELTEEFGSKY